MEKIKPLFVILDAGHGGVINGKYQTAGKRSPVWSDGSQLLEGVFNREIVEGIDTMLFYGGISSHILVPEQEDVSLSERVKRANAIYEEYKATHEVILISVHANAGGGTGFEVYTYHGQTQSDVLATFITDKFAEVFPNERLRKDLTDGDPDKEANFYVLRKTKMPAVLTENFFMDTEKDCKILLSDEGKRQIVDYHIMAIAAYDHYRGHKNDNTQTDSSSKPVTKTCKGCGFCVC